MDTIVTDTIAILKTGSPDGYALPPGVASQLTVRRAQRGDLPRIQDHLTRLSADDRSLRFSAGVVSDDTVRAYVARLRLGHDVVVCLVDRDDIVVGLAHGCVYEVRGGLHVEAAFSVDAAWRGQGWASA